MSMSADISVFTQEFNDAEGMTLMFKFMPVWDMPGTMEGTLFEGFGMRAVVTDNAVSLVNISVRVFNASPHVKIRVCNRMWKFACAIRTSYSQSLSYKAQHSNHFYLFLLFIKRFMLTNYSFQSVDSYWKAPLRTRTVHKIAIHQESDKKIGVFTMSYDKYNAFGWWMLLVVLPNSRIKKSTIFSPIIKVSSSKIVQNLFGGKLKLTP